MSGPATTLNNVKRSRKASVDINSGSTTNNKSAGNTNNVRKTTSSLQAALVSQKLGFESLPKVSLPFLKTSFERIISYYIIHYYALMKYNGMKSTVDYVSPSARKLNIVLTSDSEAQESEVFMTLQDNLTARLEEFRIEITRDYCLIASELTVLTKQRRYYTAICQGLRLLAKTYVSLCNITNYSEHQAVIDLYWSIDATIFLLI